MEDLDATQLPDPSSADRTFNAECVPPTQSNRVNSLHASRRLSPGECAGHWSRNSTGFVCICRLFGRLGRQYTGQHGLGILSRIVKGIPTKKMAAELGQQH